MGLGRCFPFLLRASHLEKLPAVLHQEVDDDLVVSPDRALERRVAKPVDRVRVHLLLLEEPLRDAKAALRRGEVEWGPLVVVAAVQVGEVQTRGLQSRGLPNASRQPPSRRRKEQVDDDDVHPLALPALLALNRGQGLPGTMLRVLQHVVVVADGKPREVAVRRPALQRLRGRRRGEESLLVWRARARESVRSVLAVARNFWICKRALCWAGGSAGEASRLRSAGFRGVGSHVRRLSRPSTSAGQVSPSRGS